MLWPTDGHPASMAAILAHPGDIASVAVSCDGRKLLTASKDGHVNQWTINALALRARTEAVGTGPKRWQSVLGNDITFEEVQRHVAEPTFHTLQCSGLFLQHKCCPAVACSYSTVRACW
jgi:hypothetical protein